ncbi:MAG: ABC transporter ATP-binding protein [Bacteroidaceae bacterium]
MSHLLSLSSLTTGYTSHSNPKVVTRGIDASLEQGKLVCLLGSNGAGKSTLFRTISSFIPPINGHIILQDKAINQYSKNELAHFIGVVLTERLADTNMTGYDLVSMGRMPHTGFLGITNRTDEQQIKKALDSVGAQPLAKRLVSTLSDGERQKMLIAKVLAQGTPIILLDEPTAFLDFRSKLELIRMLQNLAHDEGKAILISTHDIELALQAADYLWLLFDDGSFKADTPTNLINEGFLATFLCNLGVSFDGKRLGYSL